MSGIDGGYGYQDLMDDMKSLLQSYPFVQSQVIGYSVSGRAIPAVRIGTGHKGIHYNGAVHANEWITAPILMKFIRQYVKAYDSGGWVKEVEARALYERVTLWVVPMVNPDGVELVLRGSGAFPERHDQLIEWNGGSSDFSGWKANICGVDLNDQFPANWEQEKNRRVVAGPGPRDYSGEAPLTEPEALALASFTREKSFERVISFHTQGREIYWNYNDLEPAESEAIAARLALISGYTPVKLTGSDAGYKDWFIQQYRKPGFTVEVGSGVNPLPLSQLPAYYEEIADLLAAALDI